ncbi:hypothetical protein LCGC14_1781660 [marine sediment metagenome]|uniref:Uncharacterized protein n=1 Tax=marine sediment metagenome TaxID=412755 RepID=A0A0F9JA54_9ZZZZ
MPKWHAKIYKTMGIYELQVDADTEAEAHAKLEKIVAEKKDLPALLFPDIGYITVLMEERSRKVMNIVKEINEENE